MASSFGQETLLGRMAQEVCHCLERGRMDAPEIQAKACLEKVAMRYEKELAERYSLDAKEPAQRELLADRLADELLGNCPILTTLRLEKEEKQRWSDGQEIEKLVAYAYTSEKNPPRDPATSVTGESLWEWRVTGKVIAASGNSLRLKDTRGRSLTLEVSPALKRQYRPQVGAQITIRYRREWRKSKDVVAFILLDIL